MLFIARVTAAYHFNAQRELLLTSISFQPTHFSRDTLQLNNQNKKEREGEYIPTLVKA
jgi:hypothetical protein